MCANFQRLGQIKFHQKHNKWLHDLQETVSDTFLQCPISDDAFAPAPCLKPWCRGNFWRFYSPPFCLAIIFDLAKPPIGFQSTVLAPCLKMRSWLGPTFFFDIQCINIKLSVIISNNNIHRHLCHRMPTTCVHTLFFDVKATDPEDTMPHLPL